MTLQNAGMTKRVSVSGALVAGIVIGSCALSTGTASDHNDLKRGDDLIRHSAGRMLREGRHTFRYDTFGDEAFWGGDLKLHEAIAGAKLGGVGPGWARKRLCL